MTLCSPYFIFFFFFNDTATTEIYTLSLHDALPIYYLTYTYRGHGVCIARGMSMTAAFAEIFGRTSGVCGGLGGSMHLDRKSTRLNSSHGYISYAVFCLKKKNKVYLVYEIKHKYYRI